VRLVPAVVFVKVAVQVVPLTPFGLGDTPTAKPVDTGVDSSAVKMSPVLVVTFIIPPSFTHAVNRFGCNQGRLKTAVPSTKRGELAVVRVQLASSSVDSVEISAPPIKVSLTTDALILSGYSGSLTGSSICSGMNDLTKFALSIAILLVPRIIK
jgi:hypothetical protein